MVKTDRLSKALIGVVAAALVFGATTAVAGSGVGAPFNLGQTNTVNGPSTLTGTTAGPQLKVVNANASNQAVVAQNSGAGSGIAVFGTHSSAGGTGPAVQGTSASTAANAFSLYGLISSTSPGVGSAAVRGRNNGTGANGYGVWGSQAGSGTGVYGYAPHGRGVAGFSDTFQGVFGHSTANAGVVGESSSFDGVFGVAHKSTTAGVSGHNDAGGYAVWGGTTGNGTAIRGASQSGTGVYGSGGSYGVWGQANTIGVYAAGTGAGSVGAEGVGTGWGVYGAGDTIGLYGTTGSGIGVYGQTGASNGQWAGYFKGNVHVTGSISYGGASLKMDDPRDPARKYLQHSSVASSQQLDIYSGNVTTNEKGFATVTMPRWFQSLNRSVRYQLTSLSGLQEVAVTKEIAHNRFTIQSEKPHAKVSWQVTGIRHDRYANAHPVRVVVPKPKAERGKYLHPELYGKPRSQAIGYQKPPRLPRRPTSKP